MAVDAKVTIDDNALYRHKDYVDLRDLREENPIEVEAIKVGLNYVELDGNVGGMVNGAGLAMATMDLIKQAGGEPANFLDVGGTADAARVEAAFKIILKEGRKRQIRRMVEKVDNRVVGLHRTRISTLLIGRLKMGQWRHLLPDEVAALRKSCGIS